MENYNLIKVYAGSELEVNLLKAELENQGISSIIKNDFASGVVAGFGGGTPSSIYLYVKESDVEKSNSIINEFMAN